MVARLLKYLREIQIAIALFERILAHCPKRKDKRVSGPAMPLFGQIVDVASGCIGLQCRIADQQTGIVPAQHLLRVRRLRRIRRSDADELAQENFQQRNRCAGRVVRGNAANFLHWNLADQQDGPYRPFGGNRNVRNDDQIGNRRKSRDRNDSNIGDPALQFFRAARGNGVTQLKFISEVFGGVFVLKIPH